MCAKLFKPIYQCDGCGEFLEISDQVRCFDNNVKSGDESKIYTATGLYCLDCIPLILDFKNENPPTLQLVEPKKQSSDISNKIEKLEIKFEELASLTDQLIENISIINRKLSSFENIIVSEDSISNEIVEEVTPVSDLSEPEEIINEVEEIEEINEPIEGLLGNLKGKYLILHQISNEDNENLFAKKYGYKDIQDLKSSCGTKSLLGVYYSTDRYFDLKDLKQPNNIEKAKVINNMFFGVPNIVERPIILSDISGIAFIEKELFKDKIEPYEESDNKIVDKKKQIISPKKVLTKSKFDNSYI